MVSGFRTERFMSFSLIIFLSFLTNQTEENETLKTTFEIFKKLKLFFVFSTLWMEEKKTQKKSWRRKKESNPKSTNKEQIHKPSNQICALKFFFSNFFLQKLISCGNAAIWTEVREYMCVRKIRALGKLRWSLSSVCIRRLSLAAWAISRLVSIGLCTLGVWLDFEFGQ